MMYLITKIRDLRRIHKMQQSDLAKLVHVRRETISNIENGKYNLSLKLALDIAHVFGKPVEDIFEYIEEDDLHLPDSDKTK